MLSLLAPLELPCGAVLPNRLAKAAMSEQLSDRRNAPTERLVRLYERWAGSGAGLLITGNVMVDRRALGEPRQVVLEGERNMQMLRRWAAAATASGAQAWMQLNHPGRQSPRILSRRPVAPSSVRLSGTAAAFARPRALAPREIGELVERFATAARLAAEAGFDGVQIHGAHGYLVSQFLSPRTNLRDDAWGGTSERRMRFLLDVVRAVRAAIGPRVPLGVKLNSADFQRGGFSQEDSMAVVEALEAERIDLLEVSGGTFETAAMMGVTPTQQRERTRQREAYFLEYAETVRSRTRTPLMLTGGFRTATAMTAAIDEGAVDVVGLARPLALEPDLPRRILDGGSAGSELSRRRAGPAKLDALAEVVWYTRQLWRMGAGSNPDPSKTPVGALLGHLAASTRDAALRSRA